VSKTKITQQMRYRESLIKYANKHGVSKAARVYNTSRQYIYRWMKRYDGTTRSLANQSRRPKSHPNQHTPEELKLIKDMFDVFVKLKMVQKIKKINWKMVHSK